MFYKVKFLKFEIWNGEDIIYTQLLKLPFGVPIIGFVLRYS